METKGSHNSPPSLREDRLVHRCCLPHASRLTHRRRSHDPGRNRAFPRRISWNGSISTKPSRFCTYRSVRRTPFPVSDESAGDGFGGERGGFHMGGVTAGRV
ncbi:hypothetical protein EJ110_NYTH03628 [Nymphaea thermarum]|nr:hypothetical protein EJ110_NYTH03628 [Nymphaea thermarum]